MNNFETVWNRERMISGTVGDSKNELNTKALLPPITNRRELGQPAVNPSVLSSGDWCNPIVNPCITIYTEGGNKRPWRAAFGKVRPDNSSPNHYGLDLFAIPGTEVFACMNGTVISAEFKNGWGNNIVIKIDNSSLQIFKDKLRRDYTLFYTEARRAHYENETEYQMKGFPTYEEKQGITTSDNVFFRFAHLSEMFVKAGDSVIHGKKIGLTGMTGIGKDKKGNYLNKTKGPHLHLEIRSDLNKNGYGYYYNPAYYVNYKNEDLLSPEDRKAQDAFKEDN